MGSVTIFKKEIPSKHKSSLISLFKIHISFSAGVKEKNFNLVFGIVAIKCNLHCNVLDK